MNAWIFIFISFLLIAAFTWRKKALLTIALIIVGWYILFPFGWFNYKLTLVVDTPEGQKIASVVRRVSISSMPALLPDEHGVQIEVTGEALVMDLGKRGVMFALLKGGGDIDSEPEYIVFNNFPFDGVIASHGGLYHYSTLKEKKELSFDKLPMLVRFRDINDPKTVEKVDPNDLEKTFGKGVKLTSVTLEMTDEGVTRKVKRYMPPFDEKTGYLEWFRNLPYGDTRDIGPYDFIAR